MAVAGQAALLDELMGKCRNVAIGNLALPHWSDDEICKFFLAGLCPHDLFTNTKDDLGLCDRIHDQSMFAKYKLSRRFGKMKYEEKLCSYLKELITSVENRIRRGQNRLKRNGSLVHSIYNSERTEKLKELDENINSTLNKVEKLGTEGKVQESQVLLELAENLKSEKVRVEREIDMYNMQAKELEVCMTCGAFQVKGDAQQRIEEHLQGKMHIGYAQIRQYLSDFERNRNKAKGTEEPGSKRMHGSYSKNRISKSIESNSHRDKKSRKRKRSRSKEKHSSDNEKHHKRRGNSKTDKHESKYSKSKAKVSSTQKQHVRK